eukprot:jgi/Bigna1/66782/fgenesh1_pg.2_\
METVGAIYSADDIYTGAGKSEEMSWRAELVGIKRVQERLDGELGTKIDPLWELAIESLKYIILALYDIEKTSGFYESLPGAFEKNAGQWDDSGRSLRVAEERRYSHTSFYKLTCIFEQSRVLYCIKRAKAQGLKMLVLGSTIGWVALLFPLAYRMQTVAYEPVSFLMTYAKRVYYREVVGRGLKANITFLEQITPQDPSMASFEGVGVVYIDCIGYKGDLRTKIYVRLLCDLPIGSIVVDDTSFLASFPAQFKLISEVKWSVRETMFVYEKTNRCMTSPKSLFDALVNREQQLVKAQERRSRSGGGDDIGFDDVED